MVGGMALPKQERQLRLRPHVVVATPGRLWKFMSEGNEFLSDFSRLQSFVLDEADRMVEHGHFHELEQILKQLGRGGVDGEGWGRVQKFIFSATLTMEKEKKGKGKKKMKKEKKSDKKSSSASKEAPAEKGSIGVCVCVCVCTLVYVCICICVRMCQSIHPFIVHVCLVPHVRICTHVCHFHFIEELIAMVGINKDQSVTIDLTSQQLLVKTLTEAKIICGEEDKVCVCCCCCYCCCYVCAVYTSE